jgi:uncharacterized protein YebE (UPF0316 family)
MELNSYIGQAIIIFFILTLINVMLSTIKSIITVKGTRWQATLMNAIAYGFYTIIIKQITSFNAVITVSVTIIANLIGVYSSMWILDKFKKDKLWTISVTAKNGSIGKEIISELRQQNIPFKMYDVIQQYGTTIGLDIFSENQKTSVIIKNILSKYEVKYHVFEVMENL